MITIEKVVVLRSVPFFVSIPDDVLASIAQITEEVDVGDGETFIHEGTVDDCLYLIVEGQARVFSQGNTIIMLGAGQTVGELSVLDSQPRSASVAAVGRVRLFKIDKEPFDEVMTDRPEIAKGVIRALCARLRAQGRQAAAQPGLETPVDIPSSTGDGPALAVGSHIGGSP